MPLCKRIIPDPGNIRAGLHAPRNDVRGLKPNFARKQQVEPLAKRAVKFSLANAIDSFNPKSRVGLARYASGNGLL